VKAHTGIEGNEVADTLVKESAQDKVDRNSVYDRIPILQDSNMTGYQYDRIAT